MADKYGSDFITIVADDGTEYELEVLSTLEYNGFQYLAAIPAQDDLKPEVLVLKSTEEDGDPILTVIENEQELDAVQSLLMDSLFDEEETE